MIKSKLRGHEIEFLNGEWVYLDTKEPSRFTYLERSCGKCGEKNTPEGHDPCLGTLPGVMNACCGHGVVKEAYIQYEDGSTVRGEIAIHESNKLRDKVN